MKAKELMIGDWVRNALLNEVFKMNTTAMRNMCWDEDNGTACYNIEPIPLTEEILKLNGLDPISYCDLSMPRWFMSLRNGNHHVEMSFQYVHQLQHALRLCGLQELADNFKIQ